MVSIWSAALLRLIYVRACPRPLRNKLCVTTAAAPLLDCWLAGKACLWWLDSVGNTLDCKPFSWNGHVVLGRRSWRFLNHSPHQCAHRAGRGPRRGRLGALPGRGAALPLA